MTNDRHPDLAGDHLGYPVRVPVGHESAEGISEPDSPPRIRRVPRYPDPTDAEVLEYIARESGRPR